MKNIIRSFFINILDSFINLSLVFKRLYGLVLFFFLVGVTSALGQIELDYQPIVAEGSIPQDFLNHLRGKNTVSFKNTASLSKKDCSTFRQATKFTLKDLFNSGKIYYNDPITVYVREVAAALLKEQEGSWPAEINVYVSKEHYPNATAWQDGTIIVNIGLLSRLENETQLAFVLAHEMAHYRLQHPYEQYAQQVVTKEGYNKKPANNFNKDYLLTHEIVADSIALSILRKSSYSTKEAPNALLLLLDNSRHSIDFIDYFESNSFKVKNKELCKSQHYKNYKRSSLRNTGNHHFSEGSIKKRKRKVDKIVEGTTSNMTNSSAEKVSDFSKIMRIAQFEMVEHAFNEKNYLKSIYEALTLLDDFSDNKYLHTKIAENLYYIGFYNKLGKLDKIFFDAKKIEEDDYAKLYCFIHQLPHNELQDMIAGFVMKQYEQYPQDENMIIITAQTVEMCDSKKAAKVYYKQYAELFPNGKRIGLVKSKL